MRVAIGIRIQDDSVDRAKDSRGRADTEPDGNDCRKCKTWVFAQLPKGKDNILQNVCIPVASSLRSKETVVVPKWTRTVGARPEAPQVHDCEPTVPSIPSISRRVIP